MACDPEEHLDAIFLGIAYAGRYGKADPTNLLPGLTWSRDKLRRLNRAIGELLKQEKDSITNTHNTD